MILFNKMTEFVRPIHKCIEDLFILDIEALCNLSDHLKHHIPDSLGESEFHTVLDSIPEESAHGLVVRESSGGGELVVLYGCDGSHCNLRREVTHLVLPESEVLLALLEYDFQGPALGVNPVGLKEAEFPIGGDESVPLCPLASLAEEQTDIAASKGHVHGNVVASQTSAVATSLLGLVEEGCELVGGILLTFVCVLRLAHLDHTEIVASNVAGSDELDDLCAGKPAVCQHIVEVCLLLDDAAYHLYHQRYLALIVLLDTLGGMGVLVMLLAEPGIKLLLIQAVIPVLSCFADNCEVNQHLTPAVGDAEEEGLETEHHGMGDMGKHLADKFRLDATFGEVRVIHHQTDRLRLLARPFLLRLAPELPRHRGENLAPVIRIPRKETVERVALAAKQAA